MKALLIFSAALISSTGAFAKTMTCLVGVYKAADMLEGADPEKAMQLVEIPLKKDNTADFTTKVNGEEVEVSLERKQYADVYLSSVFLKSPVADYPKSMKFVSAISDFLVNEGPVNEDAFVPGSKEGSTRFEYMKTVGGSMALTPKLKAALVEAGVFGQHPYTSSVISVQYSPLVIEKVAELVQAGKLQKTDVVAMATLFGCSLNK